MTNKEIIEGCKLFIKHHDCTHTYPNEYHKRVNKRKLAVIDNVTYNKNWLGTVIFWFLEKQGWDMKNTDGIKVKLANQLLIMI